MIYDITRRVTATLPVWPGDQPFRLEHMLRIVDGASVNLTTMTTTAHLGTHADAYYHFAADGRTMADMPLDAYMGLARVVSVCKPNGPLYPVDLGDLDLADTPRLLIHTPVSDLDEIWPEVFSYLSVELIDWLAERGVRLIGLDSPSVDAFESTDLPCHRTLQRHGMVNLESLLLRNVPDGAYELMALPLKLDGACGSPVRAVLRALS